MRDPLPKFIPRWSKTIRKVMSGKIESEKNSFGFNIADSTRDLVVDGERLNWYNFDRCYVGESFNFNWEKTLEFTGSKFDKEDFEFGHSHFKSLNEFYKYKKELYNAVQRFNKRFNDK